MSGIESVWSKAAAPIKICRMTGANPTTLISWRATLKQGGVNSDGRADSFGCERSSSHASARRIENRVANRSGRRAAGRFACAARRNLRMVDQARCPPDRECPTLSRPGSVFQSTLVTWVPSNITSSFRLRLSD